MISIEGAARGEAPPGFVAASPSGAARGLSSGELRIEWTRAATRLQWRLAALITPTDTRSISVSAATGRVICCGALCTVRSTPSRLRFLIGTNDIGWLHRTAADTVAGIDAVANCISVCRLQRSSWWDRQATAARGCGRPRPRSNPPWRPATVTAKCPRRLIGISQRRFSKTASWIAHYSATLSKSRRNRLCTLLRKDRNGWLLLSSRH
jgi:hypothetical protein